MRLDGYTFAGTKLRFEKDKEQRAKELPPAATITKADDAEKTAVLKQVLLQRYEPEKRLLRLDNLVSDIQLNKVGTWDPTATRTRDTDFFQGLMRVCQSEDFTSREEKAEKIQSVTLANNGLITIAPIAQLASVFPDIYALDISNNKLKDLKALEAWRGKFKRLRHLVISPNPIEQEEPNYESTITRWFPSLQILNSNKVIANEQNTRDLPKDSLPLQTIKDNFRDEGGIAENVIRDMIMGMDRDRTTFAQSYYDNDSVFSVSFNASAPRLDDNSSSSSKKPTPWDPYLKSSRNLKKVVRLPQRIERMARGVHEISRALEILPPTRHPDLVNENNKYSFNCTPIPGIPDPSGYIQGGVGGLKIDIFGQFDELDAKQGVKLATRSFSRAIILGPGKGGNKLRILNDCLMLRAEGGYDAFNNPEAKKMPESLPLMAAENSGFPVTDATGGRRRSRGCWSGSLANLRG